MANSNTEKVERWRKKYPEKRRAQKKRYYAKHGDEIRVKNRERARAKALIMTPEEKDAKRTKTRARYDKNRITISEFKSSGCVNCGENDQRCLDLHHRNPAEKKFVITRLIVSSDKVVSAELAKCDVLCANCHRKLHNGNRDSRSLITQPSNPGRPRIPDQPPTNA